MYSLIFINIVGILGFVSALQNDSIPFHESNAVVKVSRGERVKTDSLYICSKNAEPLETYFNKAETTSTMSCTNTDVVDCKDWPLLKRRYFCTCKGDSQTFAGSRRLCVSNSWLREGCSFRFGSWKYTTGWTWNTGNDPLLSMYLDPGYAITGSFNVPTRDYKRCYVVNITIFNEHGQSELFPYDPRTIQMYKLRNFFQISWFADNVDLETSAKLSGKIFRLYLSCDIVQISDWDPVGAPLVSCLVFKATGNTTFVYAPNEQEKEEPNSNMVGVALGVTFGLILVIIAIVLGIFIWRRRRGTGQGCNLPKLPRCCENGIRFWKK